MFSSETEMHARYVCDMSSVQVWVCICAIIFAHVYVCVNESVYVRACMQVRTRVCWKVWHFYHSTLVCLLVFFLAHAASAAFFYANAFECRLALALPGYSLQLKSFVPKWHVQHLNRVNPTLTVIDHTS